MALDAFNVFMTIFMLIFLLCYVLLFYVFIIKKDVKRQQIRRFYNAVKNIYGHVLSINFIDVNNFHETAFQQLKLNYEKLCQAMPNSNYNSILDLLETIVYYYDTLPEKLFKNLFTTEKQPEIRDFLVQICEYIKSVNPFISSPLKEGELMRTIKDALDNNNPSLGNNSLIQLSLEIEIKEKLLIKKDKENQRANVISIVGVILTLFFGIISIYSFK